MNEQLIELKQDAVDDKRAPPGASSEVQKSKDDSTREVKSASPEVPCVKAPDIPPADSKEKLVMLIKAGQRGCQDWKADWACYAGEKLHETFDPNLHDAEDLQGFVSSVKKKYEHQPWFQSPEKHFKDKHKGTSRPANGGKRAGRRSRLSQHKT